jgi:hypothetical protein
LRRAHLRCFDDHGGHAEPVIGRALARPVGFAHPTKLTDLPDETEQELLISGL